MVVPEFSIKLLEKEQTKLEKVFHKIATLNKTTITDINSNFCYGGYDELIAEIDPFDLADKYDDSFEKIFIDNDLECEFKVGLFSLTKLKFLIKNENFQQDIIVKYNDEIIFKLKA